MSLPDQLAARIADALRTRGPMSRREIQTSLACSQPSFSRAIALIAGDVCVLGTFRNRRYALRRPLEKFGSEWPIYRIDAAGVAHRWATLTSVHPGFALTQCAPLTLWFPSWADHAHCSELPFFLHPARPQGVLGRRLALEAAPRLGLPENPSLWSDDDLLVYLIKMGQGAPGDFLLGEEALAAWKVETARIRLPQVVGSDRGPQYTDLIERRTRSTEWVSGESPQFLTTVEDAGGSEVVDTVVKYSTAREHAVASPAEPDTDSLRAEALALRILANHGYPTAPTALYEDQGRVFLEIRRPDRGLAGGRGCAVDLTALSRGLLTDEPIEWTTSADRLLARKLVDAPTFGQICVLEYFAELLGNDSAPPLNLTFSCGLAGELALGPITGLRLPSPDSGRFAPNPPMPKTTGYWRVAAGLAVEFWRACLAEPHFSANYRRVSQHYLDGVESMARWVNAGTGAGRQVEADLTTTATL